MTTPGIGCLLFECLGRAESGQRPRSSNGSFLARPLPKPASRLSAKSYPDAAGLLICWRQRLVAGPRPCHTAASAAARPLINGAAARNPAKAKLGQVEAHNATSWRGPAPPSPLSGDGRPLPSGADNWGPASSELVPRTECLRCASGATAVATAGTAAKSVGVETGPPMDERLATLGPEQLEAALRREGLLENGTVHDFAVDRVKTTVLSRIAWLRVEYAGEAQGAPGGSFSRPGIPSGWRPAGMRRDRRSRSIRRLRLPRPGGSRRAASMASLIPGPRRGTCCSKTLSETHSYLAPGRCRYRWPSANASSLPMHGGRRPAGTSRSSIVMPRPHVATTMRRCGPIRTVCRSRSRHSPTGWGMPCPRSGGTCSPG